MSRDKPQHYCIMINACASLRRQRGVRHRIELQYYTIILNMEVRLHHRIISLRLVKGGRKSPCLVLFCCEGTYLGASGTPSYCRPLRYSVFIGSWSRLL